MEADVTLLRSHITVSLHPQERENFLRVVDGDNNRHRFGSTNAGMKHARS
ncbi:hypothetical protein F441_14011 [Phytophthora nicotianae CJ01A1]|uniref:Uncharacterized protein n=6 Tax=Phytophthora nicotianae TaxID=4792 RepID=W2PVW7_PHYN3|nr:hypothetical protein PPTG_23539 [Phytophthora nicotianae INRA-310]ETI40536.1 hypothetical protein F443_14083 [Phytophthora nicotianae P1569]ETK80665.1 hypothetical protein L915_13728 [Phytophthora nicotianae]ETO69269.1 hypothetical protein F444_14113 [Phytophthora nicotianae P1976]ETP10365.1 hypothetical protein F441_14011 [Phytophthora nicotianae CJ01A1]ETP38488.1 hypothetical protein F442_13928 [Phytophthora nicotianae P10297]